MQRRHFLQNIAWLTGGFILSRCTPAGAVLSNGQSVKGSVRSGGKGVKNVAVSDGYSIVLTDKKGKYELVPYPESTSIFISTPSGYAFKNENGIARHYRLMEEVKDKDVIFDLVPLDKDDNEHQFIIWADPQVANAKDVEKMMNQSVPDVQKLVAASNGALMHGITVGDIVWDKLELFADYDKAVAQMGIPFFPVPGQP